jgi:hypothetical protein
VDVISRWALDSGNLFSREENCVRIIDSHSLDDKEFDHQ